MNLTTATDFELAFYLLGSYEQEVRQTGMIDYPVHYGEDLQLVLDFVEELSPPPLQDTWVNNFELSCDLPTPCPQNLPESVPCSTANSGSQTHPAVITVNVPTSTVIIPADTTPSVTAAPCPTDTTSGLGQISESSLQPSLEEQLLKHQEEERRLFYLYVQELESSGDLTKLPQVVRP
ncbi:MAG: hypothetical protein VKL42_08805 [Snowella sp.]|nr:hypothetical protein [Snowella sp.]